MGKYLDIIRASEQNDKNDQRVGLYQTAYDINDINDKSPSPFGRLNRFCRTFEKFQQRCPEYVSIEDWQQAVADGEAFLAKWADQAEALGWSSRDLFGLAPIPVDPHPSYQRLSRYDQTGLICCKAARLLR